MQREFFGYAIVLSFFLLALLSCSTERTITYNKQFNLIENGDFNKGRIGDLPDGWTLNSARPSLAPVFRLVKKDGSRFLMAAGNGKEHCVGFLSTEVPIKAGRTYDFKVFFKKSAGLNPQQHLLFMSLSKEALNGIHKFCRLEDGWIEGNAKIYYADKEVSSAEVRILFRFSAKEKVWIKSISLTESEPIEPRYVRVGCTNGKPNLESCRQVLDTVGKAGVDIVLLPEYMRGEQLSEEVPDDPSSKLMSEKAKQYKFFHIESNIQ